MSARLRAAVAPLRGEGRGWVVTTVAAGWLVVLGTRFVLPAVLPQITADFDINNTTAGFAVTLVWLAYAGMQLPGGVLVDRLGERRLLATSTAVGGLGIAALALSPVVGAFLLASAAFGLGTGLFGTARGTVLSRVYREHDGAAFGVVLAAGSLGAASLPFVAGALAPVVGWRAVLGAFGPAFLLVAGGLWWAVPPGTRPAGRTVRSLRRDAGAVRAALSNRAVTVAAVGASLMLFAFQGLTAFLPTYLVVRKGLSPGTAAGLFAVLFAAGAGFQFVAGGAADRLGHGRVLAGVAALSVPPLLLLPVVEGLAPLLGLSAFLGVRLGVGPVTNAYVVGALPDEVVGAAWGTVRTVFMGVGATGAVAVGALADAGRFDAAFVGLAALSGVAAAVYLALPPRGPTG